MKLFDEELMSNPTLHYLTIFAQWVVSRAIKKCLILLAKVVPHRKVKIFFRAKQPDGEMTLQAE
jgi:hypothetical protein